MKPHYNIKRIRELRSYTQEFIADQLGISQSAYCKLENGRSRLSLDRIEKLSTILGVSSEDIFNFCEEKVFPKDTIKGYLFSNWDKIHQQYETIIYLQEIILKHLEAIINQRP